MVISSTLQLPLGGPVMSSTISAPTLPTLDKHPVSVSVTATPKIPSAKLLELRLDIG